MSVNGINNSPLLPNYGATRSNAAATQNTGTQGTQQGVQQSVQQSVRQGAKAAALKPQTPIAGQGTPQSVVPAEAPAGTDPTLWSVLTTDERNFFAKTASLGPLTYSRIKAVSNPVPPAARGVRLDVRA